MDETAEAAAQTLPERWEPQWDQTRQLDRDLGFAFEYAVCNLMIAYTLIELSRRYSASWEERGEREEELDHVYRFFAAYVRTRRWWLQHQEERATAYIDLNLAADPTASFGSPCAHTAAAVFVNDLWSTVWQTADLLGWARAGGGIRAEMELNAESIRERMTEVCQAVCRAATERNWPDVGAVRVAAELEVSQAMRTRQLRSRPPTGERNPQQPAPALTARDRLRLEPDSRSVRLDGELIGANVHEDFFALLDRLLASGGRVSTPRLDRQDRLRHVKWSRVFNQVSRDHTRVRRLIEGAPGLGYTLQLPASPQLSETARS